MKFPVALLSLAVLTACSTPENPQLIVEKPVVFIPADKFFNCPVVDDIPDLTELTDEEIVRLASKLLVVLDTNNQICAESISAIRRQLLSAKVRLESQE